MLKILINAYACSPDMGSEPGMAWNWCVNLAKYCELHIITEGEFRERIEQHLTLPFPDNRQSCISVNEYGLTEKQIRNIHFYYNPVSDKVRRMCWNQGDWRFYKHYRKWQWKTYEMAMEIMQRTHIDIIHQLNMIGFREPGYLWKIKGPKFVWGPIGGLKQFPLAYAKDGGFKMWLFNKIKNIINKQQLKYDSRVYAALQNATLLISSIPDSYQAIKKYHGLESVIIPETGCLEEMPEDDIRDLNSKYLKVMWVGKFDFRKRIDIALQTMATVCNSLIIFQIFGTGNEEQVKNVREYCRRLSIEDWVKIEWMGNCSNAIVQKAMRESHLFFFTSVSEDTSTVVLESISNHLPVLCFDICGMSNVITDEVGIKIPLTNPEQSVRDFAEKIEYLYVHRDILQQMSNNCIKKQKELSWDNKAKQVVELYEKMI